ncbi:polyhydroxyalkanoate depolymerase [Burkholderia gladioli]|uniref:polyhydroxyalkanoate depolymerase n=1 Tax=Burkholderia gladioli TaxID=28095 RepID=UPI002B24BDC8|nr:polyhydroxyalkanoate depolymerase [Burkholderia gladioli]MEB2547051.1 polyhydroxyalkanoate depolymerase [Burkholderia gladioli]
MWYELIEQQAGWLRAWGAAMRWAGAPGVDAANACYTDLLEPIVGLQLATPQLVIEAIVQDGQPVAIDQSIAASAPFCTLRRFARGDARRSILLCVPLAGHASVMMRETAETLLADSDVFVTDWINARDVALETGRFGLDEYVAMLDDFVDVLLAEDRPVHVVAVCQATVPCLAALALRASRGAASPASLALIGGPLDARLHPSALGIAARSHSLAWCSDTLIDVVPAGFAGRGRRIFPAYLQRAEIAMVYPDRFLELAGRCRTAASLGDARAYDNARRALREYVALLDMPAEYFLDTVDLVFQRASLAQRSWRVHDRRVDPGALREPYLLTVEGERDAVTGAGQTHAALAMCSGLAARRRLRLDIEDCDHYGLFTGVHWRDRVHPVLRSLFVRAEKARRPQPARGPAGTSGGSGELLA